MRGFVRSSALALLAIATGAALAHVPLRHPTTGAPLFWGNSSQVSLVISSFGSPDLAVGEHFPAIRLALESWNQIPGSSVRIVEVTDPLQQASTNWQSSSSHLVLFDENNSSGFFPSGSGTVAIAPVWFYSNGAIVDADVLFNGAHYSFTTKGQVGRFDVQDVATHELGHLLGFDHSPVAGSSLFPYVTSGLVLHRSLATDDWMAARARYPAATYQRITGRAVRSNGSGVAYAHLTLRDTAGRTAGAALAASDGNFQFEAVEPGTYELWIAPLEGAVTSANIGGQPEVDVDFQPTPFGPVVVAGANQDLGGLEVDPDALCVLGRPFDPLPLRATSGATTSHVLRGLGLVAGSTLTASDPDVTVVVHAWLNTSISFSVTVPSTEVPGHIDLEFRNVFGERALLSGALEVVPQNPVVTAVTPSVANADGGTALVITGSGFRPGATVVTGGRIYRDGAAGGCVVLSSTQIALATAATPPGEYDVVVIDATGVEGRLVGALDFGRDPEVASVFPAAGTSAGGTPVVLLGDGFDPGVVVSIAGIVQTLDSISDDRIEFTTTAGSPGAPRDLLVLNPIGASDASSFAYHDNPDPCVHSVEPAHGPSSGGVWVTLKGAAFVPDLEVVFGVEPSTGLGGTAAEAVVVLDSGTLTALAPPGSGVASLLVRDPATNQAAALPSAYSYQSPSKGGCLGLVDVDGPRAPFARDLWWVVLLLAICAARAGAARRRLAS